MAQLHNEYSLLLKRFEKTPKTVLAALLVSEYLNRLNVPPRDLDEALLGEWKILYQQGIVLQQPPKLNLISDRGDLADLQR